MSSDAAGSLTMVVVLVVLVGGTLGVAIPLTLRRQKRFGDYRIDCCRALRDSGSRQADAIRRLGESRRAEAIQVLVVVRDQLEGRDDSLVAEALAKLRRRFPQAPKRKTLRKDLQRMGWQAAQPDEWRALDLLERLPFDRACGEVAALPSLWRKTLIEDLQCLDAQLAITLDTALRAADEERIDLVSAVANSAQGDPLLGIRAERLVKRGATALPGIKAHFDSIFHRVSKNQEVDLAGASRLCDVLARIGGADAREELVRLAKERWVPGDWGPSGGPRWEEWEIVREAAVRALESLPKS